MVRGTFTTAMLCALLGVLVLADPSGSGTAIRVGVGKMTVTPDRATAGSTGNELIFTFLADSAALKGQTIVDVPRGWTPPQGTDPASNGYVELQPAGCTSATRITAIVGRRIAIAPECQRRHADRLLYHRASAPLLSADGYVELQPAGCTSATRITAIVGRRIAIATECQRRHAYRLLYHRASAPLLSADGYVFLTQTRPASTSKKVLFRPLGPHKQPVVRVRGAAASKLFMTVTSIATVGVPFAATVRAIDQWGNNAADYAGTVTLTSTDPAATLPGPYAYGSKDSAQHTFTGVILRTPGTQQITAIDSSGLTIQSAPITVSPFS
jgi:hypothetical protein